MNQPAQPSHSTHQVMLRAPAKINLYLEILGKRADGFHELVTVMSAVSLYDTLVLRPRQDAITKLSVTTTNGPLAAEDAAIPTGSENLVVKAVDKFREAANDRTSSAGVDIWLHKQIPVAAGLGGASSDAATALLAMQELTNVRLPRQTMFNIAAELGSDVPFFLRGGTAVCSGRGEIISPLAAPAGYWVVIVQPSRGLSTAEVYSKVQTAKPGVSENSDEDRVDTVNNVDEKLELTLRSIKNGNVRELGQRINNSLQPFAWSLNEDLQKVADEFAELNCCGHQMSGSGSCYFGLFVSRGVANAAANQLRSRLPQMNIFCSCTIGPENLMAA